MDELPYVLWTYCTTPQRSTEETPFSMTYGSKAIIPFEAGFPTLKTDQFQVDKNDLLHAMSLELIDERREVAMVKMAHYQQKLRQGYDKRVKARPLEYANMVLRKVVGTMKNPSWGKLGPNCEGPY